MYNRKLMHSSPNGRLYEPFAQLHEKEKLNIDFRDSWSNVGHFYFM